MSEVFAVLTGDLVGSTKASPSTVDHSLAILSQTLTGADWAGASALTRFRGDGWQVLIDRPEYALRLAVILAASLAADETALPTRIGIGLGPVDRFGRLDLSDAAGPAFRRADKALDRMKRGRQLAVSPEDMPRAWQATAPLLDALCQQWTAPQAGPLALKLHPSGPAQIALAETFGITAQSLNRRLQLARWREIETALRVVEAQPIDDTTQPQAIAI